ncbi:MAG: hypothetical protein AVDCRST_MAG73-1896 [uncultured Thermomicrobiales bacterium]|uniref:Uncharacterized protein n=1 Tax=uncultured Thermomicrobiales bacterium TaxID=1645740 RepID=A0A6J4U4N4_9BACT|nr:MAG: hypothetical protein AVDCRST_MAG73-1896 [uncultured Thermomicrobiales bacterium]
MPIGKQLRERFLDRRLAGPADLDVEVIPDMNAVRDRSAVFDGREEARVPGHPIIVARPGWRRYVAPQSIRNGTYCTVSRDSGGRHRSLALPGFWFRPDRFCEDCLPYPLELPPETVAKVAPVTPPRRSKAPR